MNDSEGLPSCILPSAIFHATLAIWVRKSGADVDHFGGIRYDKYTVVGIVPLVCLNRFG